MSEDLRKKVAQLDKMHEGGSKMEDMVEIARSVISNMSDEQVMAMKMLKKLGDSGAQVTTQMLATALGWSEGNARKVLLELEYIGVISAQHSQLN